MTSEELRALFEAEPDMDYYKRRSEVHFGKKAISREIYIRGDEYVEEEGSYLRIAVEEGYVYLARDMVERLAQKIRGGDSLFDY